MHNTMHIALLQNMAAITRTVNRYRQRHRQKAEPGLGQRNAMHLRATKSSSPKWWRGKTLKAVMSRIWQAAAANKGIDCGAAHAYSCATALQQMQLA